ncbi:RidA family protein [Jeongeupia naejangsanensis]|uniref:RidA family protein n=1 Tax=Jeongeupia naejangsanensis TaxID=613195 RepID=A0ABS2BLI7_9NEIS|nr:RidA family protein [Jeongeupia naejangsanensis]MBM3116471.1 RidA family protein [Jeongeupia naejangsanensis]
MSLVRIASNDRLSGAIVVDRLVFLSGQVPGSGGNIVDQTKEVLSKIDALLAEAGAHKDDIATATIYLKDIAGDFAAMNRVWSAWLSPGKVPCRTTVQAELARPAVLVEVTVTAVKPQ